MKKIGVRGSNFLGAGHTDMVQNMLEKVLNLLCNLVRSKKELAERVGFK